MSFVFGRTDIATIPGSLNAIIGSGFVCPRSGWAESIGVSLGAPYPDIITKGAIYRVSDLGFVAETEEIVGPGEAGWYILRFPTLPFLEANVKYYLVVWGTGGILATTVYFDSNYVDIDSVIQPMPEYTGVFPPYLTDPSRPGWVLSIYCTVTPTPPPPTHMLTVDSTPQGVAFTIVKVT